MKKGIKVSSGDRSYDHPYMIPERYIVLVDERLKRPNTFYSPAYREYLDAQKMDCLKEIDKKTKEDLLPR